MGEASGTEATRSSCPGVKATLLSIIARDAELPSVDLFASISKVLSSKDIFENMSLHPTPHPRQKGSREIHLQLDSYTWSLNT